MGPPSGAELGRLYSFSITELLNSSTPGFGAEKLAPVARSQWKCLTKLPAGELEARRFGP